MLKCPELRWLAISEDEKTFETKGNVIGFIVMSRMNGYHIYSAHYSVTELSSCILTEKL